jgi:hypothetical protein
MPEMNVFFPSFALSELHQLGPTRTMAFANVLPKLIKYKVERERAFRCSFETKGQVDCKLRISEVVPGVESQILYATTNDRILVLGITDPQRSQGYDLGAIADTVQALSATNWLEKGLRLNISALRYEMLAKVLAVYERQSSDIISPAITKIFWGKCDDPLGLDYPSYRYRDPFSSHDSAELMQRLLTVGFRAPEPRVVDNPSLVNRIKQLSDRLTHFPNALVMSARRWLSKTARDNFKDLMEAATIQPQVVERDDDEIIVVSKRLLQRYATPKSARQIVDTFRESSLTPFDFEETGTEELEQFTLPKLQ